MVNLDYNPLIKSDGTLNGALVGAPSRSDAITFDLVARHIWTKNIKFDGSTDAHVFYVLGNETDTAGVWTGTSNEISNYYEGLTIIYIPKVAGVASGTTLNINNLGDKSCYLTDTTKCTTHFGANTPIMFTYYNNGWRRADYSGSNAFKVYRQTTGYNDDYPLLISRSLASAIGTAGSNGSSSSVYGVMWDNTNLIPTLNPSTGVIKAVAFQKKGSDADHLLLGDGDHISITKTLSSLSTDNEIPTAKAVWGIMSVTDAMRYKGVLNGGVDVNNTTYTPAAAVGDTYKVATAGFINGNYYEVGDTFICTADSNIATSDNYTTIQSQWNVIQADITAREYLLRSGDTMYGSINVDTTDAYDLGSATNEWLNVYAKNFYGTFHGDIDGEAGTAGQLNHSISFKNLSGTTVTFNGSADVDLTTGINLARALTSSTQKTPNTAVCVHDKLGLEWFSKISRKDNGDGTYISGDNGFPVTNNANGILYLGTHSPSNTDTYACYGGQLGVSSNGRLYYRYKANGEFGTTPWHAIAWSGDSDHTHTVSINSTNYTIGNTTVDLGSYVPYPGALQNDEHISSLTDGLHYWATDLASDNTQLPTDRVLAILSVTPVTNFPLLISFTGDGQLYVKDSRTSATTWYEALTTKYLTTSDDNATHLYLRKSTTGELYVNNVNGYIGTTLVQTTSAIQDLNGLKSIYMQTADTIYKPTLSIYSGCTGSYTRGVMNIQTGNTNTAGGTTNTSDARLNTFTTMGRFLTLCLQPVGGSVYIGQTRTENYNIGYATGTNAHDEYKLHVNGTTNTTELRLDQANSNFTVDHIYAGTADDKFIKPISLSDLQSQLGGSEANITTKTVTMSLSTNWADTEIAGDELENGSYMIQILHESNIYTGTMSWNDTADGNDNEIFLHASGSTLDRLYVRTTHDGESIVLQIAASAALTDAEIEFNFRKMI